MESFPVREKRLLLVERHPEAAWHLQTFLISSGWQWQFLSVLVWYNWIQQPFKLEYPELFSFVRNKAATISSVFSQQDLSALFMLPLSSEAFQHLQALQSFIDHFSLTEQEDTWTPHWGKSSAAKTYRYLIGHRHTPQIFKWLWKCFCQPKHKVFFWLVLKDRLSTRNVLRRKHMDLDSYTCVLCQSLAEETCEHLFLHC